MVACILYLEHVGDKFIFVFYSFIFIFHYSEAWALTANVKFPIVFSLRWRVNWDLA